MVREQTASQFYPYIQEGTNNLLLKLLHTPDDFLKHIMMPVIFSIRHAPFMTSYIRFGASTLFSSTYGNEATESSGFSLGDWEQVPEMLAAGMPGAFLVVSLY